MQTFLTHYASTPSEVFRQTAIDLDWQRLGKQRVEAFQILRTLSGQSEGWANHPCTKMWRGYNATLNHYMKFMIEEWISRGYRNTMQVYAYMTPTSMPEWFTPELVRSHQSNLIRKKPDWYAKIWPGVPDDLPYIWPV